MFLNHAGAVRAATGSSGRLVAIGVAGAKHSSAAPGIPTIAESGLPRFEAVNWSGLLARGAPHAAAAAAAPAGGSTRVSIHRDRRLHHRRCRGSLAAVPILEQDFGKPVVTHPISEIWRLIVAGVAPPVEGWGRRLANP